MRRLLLIGTIALLVVSGGAYVWPRMHARGYS
jgi:hypothetical protein